MTEVEARPKRLAELRAQNEEAFAELDAMVEDLLATEKLDQATLSDMLAEAAPVQARGAVYMVVPPSIRQMRAIIPVANAMTADDPTSAVDAAVAVAQMLLWTTDEAGVLNRRVTRDEVLDHFRPDALMLAITGILAAQGLEQTDTGESQSRTGESSSAPSADTSPDTGSSTSET